MRSEDVRKVIHVGTCELAHLRMAGRLRFRKVGNAFLYNAADIDRLRRPPNNES